MGLVSELRRRNVFRMAALYIVAAWLIMQVAEVVKDLANLPDWIGPAILGLLAIGFPIALVFSWFYELTPEGLALEKDVERTEAITHITGRRMNVIVISLLSAAVLLFAWHTWWPSVPTDKSIAVLAFENISGDPEQEYFSDGIAEELLNALAHVPGLRVISRSSAFSFKGKDVAIPAVAAQLNVAHVVEGSVRTVGNRVRITVQLIDARTDSHLWSETYDHELDDVFAVQNEIAAAITDALKLELVGASGKSAVPTGMMAVNTEAHDACLRGRYLMSRGKADAAAREFEKAIFIDPNYALAHAELALAHVFMMRLDHGGDLTANEAIATATIHTERAMELDPGLAEAHAAAGLVAFARQGFGQESLAHFERALRINPNYSIVHSWVAMNYAWLGRYKESFAAEESALRTNPVSVAAINNYAEDLIARNRMYDANREIEKLVSLAPATAARFRGVLASGGGRWANFVLGALDGLRLDPEDAVARYNLNRYFAYLGLDKEALAMPPTLIAPHRPNHPATLMLLGRSEDAVRALEALLAEDPNFFYRGILGLTLAGAGDYGRARPTLEESWQWSGGVVTANGVFSVHAAAALIAIYQQAGEASKVAELLAAIRDNVRRYREAGITATGLSPYFIFYNVDYEEGLAAFLSGEHERGLALIGKAAEAGYFIPTNEAYLRELYNDPNFAAIRASQETRQARERRKLLGVVCTNNPYEDVWRPAEGTCERFATSGEN